MKGISLFSGCGGDTLGMLQAGINVVGYNEIDETYCKTHDRNMPNCKRIGKDIQKMKESEWEPYKNVDILFGGIPCQSFSQGGKKDPNDPRGQLYIDYMKVVKLLQPKYCFIENVKGLLKRKTADDVKFFDKIVEEFNKLGYNTINYKLFKCEKYGVPQKRERLIIVATKGNSFIFPEEEEEVDLQNIVKFDMTNAFEVPEELFEEIPEECIVTDLTNEEEGVEGHPFSTSLSVEGFSFGKRVSPRHCEIADIRKPTKTIICSYKFQPRLYVPLRNKNGCYLRTFTVEELKQIQGFPKDFILEGSEAQQITQIGNAIPPPLIKSLFKTLINNIN